MKRRRLINDILLISALVLIPIVILLININPDSASAGTVVITVDNEVYAYAPLSEDAEIIVNTEKGINKVTIRDGEAWVSDADCYEKICVQHRAISKTGEQIVCLPHKVVLEIISGQDKDIDSISQ